MQDYLLEFPVYNPTDIDTYIEAANIYKKCAGKGRTVRKTIDCLIAAISIENSLTLLHNDSDFYYIAESTNLKILSVKGA